MPTLTYPFIAFKTGDLARPYVPIGIVNPATSLEIEIFALIDTGSDECAFPSRFADILGHDLTAGRRKPIQTGNGETIAYGHTSIISLDEFSTGPIAVDYLENLDTPLLGMQSFLSHFVITLDYPEKTVSLEF